MLQSSLKKSLAECHTLIVVLRDSLAVAQRDTDGIVGGSQIQVLDSSSRVSGVYDGFSLIAVLN